MFKRSKLDKVLKQIKKSRNNYFSGELNNIVFLDFDGVLNLDINNLISISRHQLLVLNGNNLIYEDTDLTKTGVNIANLIIKLRDFK